MDKDEVVEELEDNEDPKEAKEPTPENIEGVLVDDKMVIPYMPDLSGVWGVEPRASKVMYRMLERFFSSGFDVTSVHPSVTAKASYFEEQNLTERYVTRYNEGIAVIEIAGTMMKEEPPSRFLNASAITYPQITELVAGLVDDDSVDKIILKIASNGGNLEGLFPCADSIYDYGKQKPIIAFCDDKCNSAAYLIASQCKEIIAGEGTNVGSIGVMVLLTDESAKDEMLGYKRYVVASTKLKGLGADRKVTKELLAEVQTTVDDYYELFKERVMRGRGMTEEEMGKAATGSIFLPEEALALKLIDKVTNFYKVIDPMAEAEDVDDPSNFDPNDEGRHKPMAMTPEEQVQFDAAIKETDRLTELIGDSEEAKKVADEQAAKAEAKEKQEIQGKLQVAEEEKERLAKQVEELTAKQEVEAKARAEQEMTNRKTTCLSWIQQRIEAGAIIPANVPKLKAFLGIMLPIDRVIESEYQSGDGTTKKFEGQLYQFALEVLGDSATKKIDFSESANSHGSSDKAVNTQTDWFEKELEKDGVRFDDDQVLAKTNKKALTEVQDIGIVNEGWN